ncbi:MAG: ATP-grasp domain-containing protein [Pseudomonadota bacterium]
MQWILQEFGDTHKLAAALDRLEFPYTVHKVVPFVGDLIPEPEITDPNNVVMFGSYGLWRNAAKNGYRPGVFKLRPFVYEVPWQPFMLNGPDAVFLTVAEVPSLLTGEGDWFVRPVSDSKEQPGKVLSANEMRSIAEKVVSLDEHEIPLGSLRHETTLMFTRPASISKEWRVWIVNDKVVTFSLYKEGTRILYRREIDGDAMGFVEDMIAANPGFAPAYVMDICRTDEGLKFLETNCINAAGFYEADVVKLAVAIDGLATTQTV